MIVFAFYLLKVCICSGILFFYYLLALRNKLFHQWNRFYLLIAVVLSLIVPIIQITISHELAENKSDTIQLLKVVESTNNYLDEITISSANSVSTDQMISIVYSITSVVFLLLLLHESSEKLIRLIN